MTTEPWRWLNGNGPGCAPEPQGKQEALREMVPESTSITTAAGSFYTWWRDDPLPELPEIESFSAAPCSDARLLADLGGLHVDEAERRLATANTAYVASLGGQPVAYGWSAAGAAAIGDLVLFVVPPEQRYLWDFATLPAWRGRGIYPRLLQSVLSSESEEAGRFWIGHEEFNTASGRGILRAGFSLVASVRLQPEGGLGLLPNECGNRAEAAAELLGVPLLKAESGNGGR